MQSGPFHVCTDEYLGIYSPRIATATPIDNVVDNSTVLYVCGKGEFRNEFEFMLSCKAKRTNTNHYIYNADDVSSKVAEYNRTVNKSKYTEYNIVSGDKIPDGFSQEKFNRLYRYMMEGVHLYLLLFKRGVSKYTEVMENGEVILKAVEPHSFQKGDDWATNVSNVFIGTLIDYYRISSGVRGLDAQVSFTRNEQYRIKIYEHLRDVFNAFVRNNLVYITNHPLYEGGELVTKVLQVLNMYSSGFAD